MKLQFRWQCEKQTAATRAEGMRCWKEARFGLFVHLGLYSMLTRKSRQWRNPAGKE